MIASSEVVQGSGGGESEVIGGWSSGLPKEKEEGFVAFLEPSGVRFLILHLVQNL